MLLHLDPLALLWLPITSAGFSVAQFGSSCPSVTTNYVSQIKCCSIWILLHFCDYQLRQRDLALLNSDHLALLWLSITSARFSVAQFGSSCTSLITSYLSEFKCCSFRIFLNFLWLPILSEIKCCSIRILLLFCDYLVPQRDLVLLTSDPLALLWLPITAARFSIAQFWSSCTSVITNHVSEN